MRSARAVFASLASLALLVIAFMSFAAWTTYEAAGNMTSTAQELMEVFEMTNGGESYSKVEFYDNEGNLIATYTGVTNYEDHENYVSFTGTKVGGDGEALSYEINRTAFGSVTKYPNPV